MKSIVSNKIELLDVPPGLEREIRKHLTLKNPAYVDAQKMGRRTGDLEEHLFLYEQRGTGRLVTPRGFVSQLATMARKHGVSFTWTDETRELKPVGFQFKGTLRDYQDQAVTDVLRRRFGVLEAPTGSGKTIVALHLIAERKQPALVITHTAMLQAQWVDRISAFLEIPVEQIGVIGAGKKRIGGQITVAMVQSLYKCAHEVSQHIGHLVVDECHRTSSRVFTEAVTAFDSRYMLGLSATPYRRDGLTKLIYWHLGDEIHAIDQAALTENGAVLPFKVRWVQTNFRTSLDPSGEYSRMLSELTQDPERNRLVCQEAAGQAKNGEGIPLILSDRKAHCQAIAEALERDHGITPTVLTGDLSKKAREKVIARLNAGQCQALVATGQLIGEGFDLPALGSVLLATPIRFKGRLIQAIGRGLRPSPGQDVATVVDFVDTRIGVLKHSAKERLKTYRSLGAGGC